MFSQVSLEGFFLKVVDLSIQPPVLKFKIDNIKCLYLYYRTKETSLQEKTDKRIEIYQLTQSLIRSKILKYIPLYFLKGGKKYQ